MDNWSNANPSDKSLVMGHLCEYDWMELVSQSAEEARPQRSAWTNTMLH